MHWRLLREHAESTTMAGIEPISGRVDRTSAAKTIESGLIPGRAKPKTMQIGIHSFPA